MTKDQAITLLGGTITKAAQAIGITHSAISQWPETLPPTIRDRVQAALYRLHIENQERECLRGHGPMAKQPGIWVMQQVQRPGLLVDAPGNVSATGRLLTLEAYKCPVCGQIELVDEI